MAKDVWALKRPPERRQELHQGDNANGRSHDKVQVPVCVCARVQSARGLGAKVTKRKHETTYNNEKKPHSSDLLHCVLKHGSTISLDQGCPNLFVTWAKIVETKALKKIKFKKQPGLLI